MELAALVIGTSGLISVAQMCVKAAGVIHGMRTFREETASLYAIYGFESVRLNLWITQVLRVPISVEEIQSLSLEDAELPTVLTSDSPIDLRAPLHNALNEVKKILTAVAGLLEKYGATDVSLRRRAGFRTKVYKEGGQEAIQALLTEFKNWNDRLEGIVESRLRSTLVANMQIHVLASASTPEQLRTIEVASRSLHPALSNEAAFRQRLLAIESLGTDNRNDLKASAEEIIPRRAPPTKDGNMRVFGRLIKSGTASQRVLQEWKLGQTDWDDVQITTAMERATSLASMLHLDNKPERLRCLDLVGYATVDTAIGGGDTKRPDFCFLYRPPDFANESAEPITLRAALQLPERERPTLAERFNIAVTVAQSILEFHSNNWLHKAVCSSNVLFFKDKRGDRFVFSEPFVSGFEFARPDSAKDKTLDAFGGVDFDVFCHPDLVQTIENGNTGKPRYQRQYDIYGLGMTLLEIGCWMPVANYLRKKSPGRSVQDHFVKICNEAVPSRMGTQFRDVIAKCFAWPPDAEKVDTGFAETEDGKTARRGQIEEFMMSVVNVLQGCHCRS